MVGITLVLGGDGTGWEGYLLYWLYYYEGPPGFCYIAEVLLLNKDFRIALIILNMTLLPVMPILL